MIFIVSGPGGAGKGTVVSRVLELVPDLWLSRSWTTRRRRPGETDDAYVFVDRAHFEDQITKGGFVEWTEFAGTGELYGTPAWDRSAGPGDEDVLLEIDLDGARQVKARHPEAVLFLVVAPSRAAREERLRGRGDDETSVARRVAVGIAEEEAGRRFADHVVVNDEVERAAGEVAGIISARRAAG